MLDDDDDNGDIGCVIDGKAPLKHYFMTFSIDAIWCVIKRKYYVKRLPYALGISR